jgi:hypothetical protein
VWFETVPKEIVGCAAAVTSMRINVFANGTRRKRRFPNDVDMSSLLRRELFGPIREDIWRQLAAETGASFVEGGFWKGDKVEASHGEWRITLENVLYRKTPATLLRAPYVNPDGFRFKVYRKQIFSELGKMLGMQDVEVGQPDFDRDFVIQGTDEAKLRRLFANARIRELIAAQPQILFTVKEAPGIFTRDLFADVPPEDVNTLGFLTGGVIQDKERLRLLFDLFAETLEELCRMGSAYKDAPGT